MDEIKKIIDQHPIQPVESDAQGIPRFKVNKIVKRLVALLKERDIDLNDLAYKYCVIDGGSGENSVSADDWRQFSQLTGYSLSGYQSLNFVSPQDYDLAVCAQECPDADLKDVRIAQLTAELYDIKECLRPAVSEIFNIHEDDLK